MSKIIFSLAFKSKQVNKIFNLLTFSTPPKKIPPNKMLITYFSKFKTSLSELKQNISCVYLFSDKLNILFVIIIELGINLTTYAKKYSQDSSQSLKYPQLFICCRKNLCELLYLISFT